MAIFSKKPKVRNCSVCDASYRPDQGPPHEYSHIAKISLTEPPWLPANFRAIAQGEYTFRCDRCNSFSSLKWPSEGGAYAGMSIHLGAAHRTGMFSGSGSFSSSVKFDMIPVG